MIDGYGDRKTNGITAAWGPFMNIIFALGFLPLAIIYPDVLFFELVFSINAWIGFYNMFPIWIQDGKKILDWNKLVFGIMITGAGFLVVLRYIFFF